LIKKTFLLDEIPLADYRYDVFISYRSKESDKQLQVFSDKPYTDAKF